jgi:hypothetical protein
LKIPVIKTKEKSKKTKESGSRISLKNGTNNKKMKTGIYISKNMDQCHGP